MCIYNCLTYYTISIFNCIGVSTDNLSELHGNVFIEKCEKCGEQYEREFYVMDDHASQYYEELNENGETTIIKPKHAVQCKLCKLCHRTGRKCDRKVAQRHFVLTKAENVISRSRNFKIFIPNIFQCTKHI